MYVCMCKFNKFHKMNAMGAWVIYFTMILVDLMAFELVLECFIQCKPTKLDRQEHESICQGEVLNVKRCGVCWWESYGYICIQSK